LVELFVTTPGELLCEIAIELPVGLPYARKYLTKIPRSSGQMFIDNFWEVVNTGGRDHTDITLFEPGEEIRYNPEDHMLSEEEAAELAQKAGRNWADLSESDKLILRQFPEYLEPSEL